MNIHNLHIKQQGFFDMGLGLALFAIFGVASIIISNSSEATSQQQVSCNNQSGEYKVDCEINATLKNASI